MWACSMLRTKSHESGHLIRLDFDALIKSETDKNGVNATPSRLLSFGNQKESESVVRRYQLALKTSALISSGCDADLQKLERGKDFPLEGKPVVDGGQKD